MHREGHVIEVWGDPEDPDQVRVELDPFDPDDPDEYPSDLLLPPYVVTPAAAA